MQWRASTFAAHKQWAWAAARADHWFGYVDAGAGPQPLVKLSITLYPKPRGPIPDRDNAIAAFKAYQDGIAKAIGIDDSVFDLPTIHFAERTRHGKIIVSIMP